MKLEEWRKTKGIRYSELAKLLELTIKNPIAKLRGYCVGTNIPREKEMMQKIFITFRCCTLPAPPTVLIITQGSQEPFDGPQHNYSRPQNAPRITKNPLQNRLRVLTNFSNFERTVHP